MVKNATEIEKELFAAMNNAISSMIACNSNLVAAQLKVKSSQINFKEKQELSGARRKCRTCLQTRPKG